MGSCQTLIAKALGKLDGAITTIVGLGAKSVGSRGMRCHPTNKRKGAVKDLGGRLSTGNERMRSRGGYVYLMKHSEAFEKFKEFKNEVQNQLDKKIKFLRSDRGGEYMSHEFDDHLKSCEIVPQLTPPIYNTTANEYLKGKLTLMEIFPSINHGLSRRVFDRFRELTMPRLSHW